MSDKKYTLSQLNEYLKRVIALNMRESIWVSCEIASVNSAKGHFYLDLVEKDDNAIQAKSQAVIWRSTWAAILKKRGKEIAGLLQTGFSVLFKVKVEFHEKFGLKLMVQDVDPVYTLGQMEIKRQAILALLKKQGLLHKNRQQKMPLVIQRVAVVSSDRAAGWQDFVSHLEGNIYGLRFDIQLFAASVQGEFAEREMLRQLDQIEFLRAAFDAVVIIRGGGARLDLAVFDSEVLCRRVALFPLPVLSGIGHETDETMLDKVVHTALKTPTAVADFVLERNLQYLAQVEYLLKEIQDLATRKINNAAHILQRLEQQLTASSQRKLQRESMMLDFIKENIPKAAQRQVQQNQQLLTAIGEKIRLLSPEFALARGFSITTVDGKVVRDANDLKKGDQLTTHLQQGKLRSTIDKIENKK